jgi:hypothetical protein
VWWKGARAAFPSTKLSGDGRYYINNGNMHLRLHADPVDPSDVRWAMVNLPEQGSGKLDFGLELLYGQEQQQLDLQQGPTFDDNGDVTVLGKVKRRF